MARDFYFTLTKAWLSRAMTPDLSGNPEGSGFFVYKKGERMTKSIKDMLLLVGLSEVALAVGLFCAIATHVV